MRTFARFAVTTASLAWLAMFASTFVVAQEPASTDPPTPAPVAPPPADAAKPDPAHAPETPAEQPPANQPESPQTETSKPNQDKPADEPKTPMQEAKPDQDKPAEEAKPKDEATPESPPAMPQEWAKGITWRSLGPAVMGGRIVALSVYEADPSTFWAATASGGLLKTTNNGITFEHQFDRESTVSIGDVCVAPSHRDIVWVGTGEHNPRNSVSYGDGVYKSTDGGKTWTCMGLRDSFQIGSIRIHPTNPDIVYVGALGRLYGPNETRGLYKTTDGGKTWERVLFLDDHTGIIDIELNPANPDIILAAAYQRQRDEFDGNEPAVRYGEKAGIYKSTDAGATWTRLTKGLPSCKLGRIGIDYFRANPNIVVAIVESEKNGMGDPPQGGRAVSGVYMGIQGSNLGPAVLDAVIEGGPAAAAGLQAGDVIVKFGDAELESYNALVSLLRTRKPGDKVKIVYERDGKTLETELTLAERPRETNDSGMFNNDPSRPYEAMLNGQIENVQDRQGPIGPETGGVYKSTDGGETWTRINSINPRPMYFSQVRIDPVDESVLYVLGVGLYRSTDGGKTFRADAGRGTHADHHAMWIDPRDPRHILLGNDGGIYQTYDRAANWDHLNTKAIGQFYHVAVDPRRDYKVYGGLQDNGSWGGPMRVPGDSGSINSDWFRVGGGDGFRIAIDPTDPDLIYYTSQNGAMGRRNLRTGEGSSIRPIPNQRGQRFRFNWNTPFLLSNQNPRIFYAAGNYVFRSINQGRDLRIISPEITRTNRGSATALAESPRDPNVLYVGTDDGYLWVTRDGGVNWSEVSKNVHLPGPYWVASLEASRAEAGRVYACFDAHRSNDDRPYIYVSEDYGQSWTCLNANLPAFGSTRVLREDLVNPNVLYLGTEFGVWASVTRGSSWTPINNDLPTVAVHELAQHPTSGELIAATHGRSIWACEIAAIRQIKPETLKAKATLFEPIAGIRWRSAPSRGDTNRRFVAQNPPSGTAITYALTERANKVSLQIFDYEGKLVRSLPTRREPGLHRIPWDLTRNPPPRSGAVSTSQTAGRGRGAPAFGPRVPAGEGIYKVVLNVDGAELTTGVRVLPDPSIPVSEAFAELGVVTQQEEFQSFEEGMFQEEEEEEEDANASQGGLIEL